MKVEYKRLPSGYHYARAVGFAHLFAQWPPGTQCDTLSVSAGEMPMSLETVDTFIEAAQRAADSAPVPTEPK